MPELTLDGLVVVGSFDGISDGSFPRLLIGKAGSSYKHRIDFRAFDPQTGESTQVGREIASLKIGDRVAVAVFAAADKHNKEGVHFVTLSAAAIQVLGASVASEF